jgi:myo-inositol-1(or 4)-monophosphatase
LWDYAAGVLLLAEAGGQSLTLEGEPIFRADLARRSAVATLDREVFDVWRRYLMDFTDEG